MLLIQLKLQIIKQYLIKIVNYFIQLRKILKMKKIVVLKSHHNLIIFPLNSNINLLLCTILINLLKTKHKYLENIN